MAKKIFAKKDLGVMMAETADNEKGLQRTLSAGNLIAKTFNHLQVLGIFSESLCLHFIV